MKVILPALAALAALSLSAQLVPNPVAPPAFTGSGLNDMSAAGQFGGTANVTYAVTLLSTGSPDRFSWTASDGGSGTSTAIPGGTCAALPAGTGWIALSHGVLVCWLAATGHHAGDAWSVAVTANGTVAPETQMQVGVGAVVRSAQAKLRESYSVLDFGAMGDNTTDDGPAIMRAVAATNGAVLRWPVPTGPWKTKAYRISNTAGPLILSNLSGRWSGEGIPVVFTSFSYQAFQLVNLNNFVMEHMNISIAAGTPGFGVRCPAGTLGTLIDVHGAYSSTFSDLTLANGNCAGLGITLGNNVWVYNIHVTGTVANGTQFANVSHLHVWGIDAVNTGDAAFEIDHYDSVGGSTSDCEYVTASHITSQGGNGGIIVSSCKHVAISDFAINIATVPGFPAFLGLAVTFEADVSTTVLTDDVHISNGSVTGGGQASGCAVIATLDNPTPIAGQMHVYLDNVHFSQCPGDGLDIGDSLGNHSVVTMDNSSVDTTALAPDFPTLGYGIRMGGDSFRAHNLRVDNSFLSPIYASSAADVDIQGLVTTNPNQGSVAAGVLSSASWDSAGHSLHFGFPTSSANIPLANGMTVTITGAAPGGYNLTNARIVVNDANDFTVNYVYADPGTWTGGGTVEYTPIDVISFNPNLTTTHFMVNGLTEYDSAAVSHSNVYAPSYSTSQRMIVNVDHQNVTGTGWSMTSVNNPSTDVFRTMSDSNFWAFQTDGSLSYAYMPAGFNLSIDNNSGIFFVDPGGVRQNIFNLDILATRVMAPPLGTTGLYNSSGDAFLFCDSVSGMCEIPSLAAGGGTAALCTDSAGHIITAGCASSAISALTGGVSAAGPGSAAATLNLSSPSGTVGIAGAYNNQLGLVYTPVTPGTYGDASNVGSFTVDAYGRLTGATNTPIAGPTLSGGGSCSGANPHVTGVSISGLTISVSCGP